MSIVSKHYGTEIRVSISPFNQCCGARIVHGFEVRNEGGLKNLDQKHNMYKELMRKIIPQVSGIIVTADCVLNYGAWADLRRSGGGGNTRSAKTEAVGDISLEDFCEYFGMVRGPVARNNNSGNLVASFSMAIHAANEDGTYTTLQVEEPDFSDEPKPEKASNADVEAVISAIETIIRES